MYLVSRGAGYPVLFIHGVPTSGQLWNGVIEKLDEQFTCLAVDLPGFGKNPSPGADFKNLESLADQIEQIRIERKIEAWHVVGHDAGAAVAVHYAFRYQERVKRLALLSPSIFPELKPFHLFRALRSPVIGELLAPAVNTIFWKVAMRYALKDQKAELRDTVDDFRAPFAGPFGAWRLMSMMRWGNPAEVLASVPEMLPQILVPTLIFHGASDPAIPRLFARRAASLIPQAQLIMVDSGHFIPLNNPGVVAAELLSFFKADDTRTETQSTFVPALLHEPLPVAISSYAGARAARRPLTT